MFEAFRDETYGRRNRVVAAVLAVVAVAAAGVTWRFADAILPAIAVVVVFGSMGTALFRFYLNPHVQFRLLADDITEESKKRRR